MEIDDSGILPAVSQLAQNKTTSMEEFPSNTIIINNIYHNENEESIVKLLVRSNIQVVFCKMENVSNTERTTAFIALSSFQQAIDAKKVLESFQPPEGKFVPNRCQFGQPFDVNIWKRSLLKFECNAETSGDDDEEVEISRFSKDLDVLNLPLDNLHNMESSPPPSPPPGWKPHIEDVNKIAFVGLDPQPIDERNFQLLPKTPHTPPVILITPQTESFNSHLLKDSQSCTNQTPERN